LITKTKLAIAIPASVVSDTPHLREKTSKVGLIGRAAAIFRVDKIVVYPDDPKSNQERDLDFISLLLTYLETPQYLRRRLFKIEPRLQFAGILPPLRTPHHPLSGKNKDLKVGQYREGIVLSKAKEGLLLDIGVERPAILRETQFSIRDRLTVQIINLGERTEVQTANREDIPVYWGYTVQTEKHPIAQIVNKSEYDLTIATAKLGDKFENKASSIQQKWNQSHNVLVAFGAPTRGLQEIVQQEGTRLWDVFDFVVNMIPDQGTATVRTEEALFASLAILNVQFNH